MDVSRSRARVVAVVLLGCLLVAAWVAPERATSWLWVYVAAMVVLAGTVASYVARRRADRGSDGDALVDPSLQSLRERYARGEIDPDELEDAYDAVVESSATDRDDP